MTLPLSQGVQRAFWQQIQRGLSVPEAATAVELSVRHARRLFREAGGVAPVPSQQPGSPRRLSFEEREEIAALVQCEVSKREIARRLGRAPSTITRELDRNCSRRYRSRAQLAGRAGPPRTRLHPYRASVAQHHAEQRARRPKPLKLDTSPQLRASVEAKLKRKHSPEQISQELREEFPQNPERWVSDETIYKAIFVQGKGLLKQEVARWLRTGRAMRRPHRTTGDRRGRIPGMVNVSERPAEVEDRAVPGHWEGDLILGAYGRSAIGTLVERQTRFVMLVPLPHGHTADQVEEAMLATIRKLPVAIWKSLTWDQGAEMANHAKITLATDLSIYFCDPSSPWQRGTNENTNGLLRQYFPKGTDLSVHSAEYLDFVADEMNDRPRKTLGWKRPRQAMQELIAAA
jgi:transposase, IS30 family